MTLETPMDIHQLLAAERDAIVEEAWRAILALKQYEREGEEATRRRVETLFDHVALAIRIRDLGELLDYAELLARQRFAARFELAEVQNAFLVLEEAISRCARARLPAEELPEALRLVGTAIRRGKDQLARAYVSLGNGARPPSLALVKLFRGK